jgi:predicted XRE-type DNA-binding protein
MSIETKSAHVTTIDGNIFSDLGFESDEALFLRAESMRVISEKLAVKETLMSELSQWVSTNKLKQADAAQILGITRPRLSDVVNKKYLKFTIDALVDMLERTGKHVQISIK